MGQKAIKKLEQTNQELENAETELKKKVKEGKPKGRVALSLVVRPSALASWIFLC